MKFSFAFLAGMAFVGVPCFAAGGSGDLTHISCHLKSVQSASGNTDCGTLQLPVDMNLYSYGHFPVCKNLSIEVFAEIVAQVPAIFVTPGKDGSGTQDYDEGVAFADSSGNYNLTHVFQEVPGDPSSRLLELDCTAPSAGKS